MCLTSWPYTTTFARSRQDILSRFPPRLRIHLLDRLPEAPTGLNLDKGTGVHDKIARFSGKLAIFWLKVAKNPCRYRATVNLLEQVLLKILGTKVLVLAVADLSGRLYLVDFLVGVPPIYRF
jgi:hypothetical protein